MSGRTLPPLSEIDARRIVLLKPSSLGDIVHSLPVLTALRRRFPLAHIRWVVNQTYAELLHGHPDLDEVLTIDRESFRGGFWRGARSFAALSDQVRCLRPDLVVDLQGLFRTGLLARVSGAARRVGLSTAREGATWFYTDVVAVPDHESLHAVDRLWRIAEALGGGGVPKQFRLAIPDEARRWAGERLADFPRPWLAVGVGARWRTKRWPAANFAALIRQAQDQFGGTILFVGGHDETAPADAVAAKLVGPTLNFAGRTTLSRLSALLANADVMLANDTGPLHLAAALGRPVVAPYTCTKVLLTGPYGSQAGAVETRVWCAGSRVKRCRRMECMTELTPDRLWPRLEEVLRTWEKPKRSA
jgi:heptosyltransferase-1